MPKLSWAIFKTVLLALWLYFAAYAIGAIVYGVFLHLIGQPGYIGLVGLVLLIVVATPIIHAYEQDKFLEKNKKEMFQHFKAQDNVLNEFLSGSLNKDESVAKLKKIYDEVELNSEKGE